jgi:hypothetical protein
MEFPMVLNPSRVAQSISGHAGALRTRSHDAIERAAERALPVVDQVAERAHAVAERVAIAGSDAAESLLQRRARLSDARLWLAKRGRIAISDHPFLALTLAVAAGALAYRSLTNPSSAYRSSRED